MFTALNTQIHSTLQDVLEDEYSYIVWNRTLERKAHLSHFFPPNKVCLLPNRKSYVLFPYVLHIYRWQQKPNSSRRKNIPSKILIKHDRNIRSRTALFWSPQKQHTKECIAISVLQLLRGYYIHNQKLACFVLYLKIINPFLKNYMCIL